MNKVKVIAEVAWSHDGQKEKLTKLIDLAKESGADIVDLHATSVPDYMVENYDVKTCSSLKTSQTILSTYEYLLRHNVENCAIVDNARYARSIGLEVSIMFNDQKSWEEIPKDCYNHVCIAPAVIDDMDFIEKMVIGSLENTIFFIRCGGSTLEEITKVVNILTSNKRKIVLLHGVQNFPSTYADTDLFYLRTMKDYFGGLAEIGLADHIDAEDEFSILAPLVAVGLGATYIEKHITINRKEKGEDYESALHSEELKRLVNYLPKITELLGTSDITKFVEKQNQYNGYVRKKIVAKKDILRGETVTKDDICLKRCKEGILSKDADKILNKKALVDINIDEPISLECIV